MKLCTSQYVIRPYMHLMVPPQFSPSLKHFHRIPKTALLSEVLLYIIHSIQIVQFQVSEKAKHYNPSARCQELCRPKALADGYNQARESVWAVTPAARRANITNRLDELSQPIVRATMDHVQFDPDAFLVKEAAKKARGSARIAELAQPIIR